MGARQQKAEIVLKPENHEVLPSIASAMPAVAIIVATAMIIQRWGSRCKRQVPLGLEQARGGDTPRPPRNTGSMKAGIMGEIDVLSERQAETLSFGDPRGGAINE
jgi:hypothetical protein